MAGSGGRTAARTAKIDCWNHKAHKGHKECLISLRSWCPLWFDNERRPGYCSPFSCEYTMLTNRSALVPAAPAGKSPPGTFASLEDVTFAANTSCSVLPWAIKA